MPENPYQPCGRCARLGFEIVHVPCIRVDMIDISLHRLGKSLAIYHTESSTNTNVSGSTLNDNLKNWMTRQSSYQQVWDWGVRKISLTQDMGGALEVVVAEFFPEQGDATSYQWTDSKGTQRELPLPQFYIVNMAEAALKMKEYGYRNTAKYIETLLRDSNPIIWKTFQAACRHVAETEVCPSCISISQRVLTDEPRRAH